MTFEEFFKSAVDASFYCIVLLGILITVLTLVGVCLGLKDRRKG